MLKNCCFWPRLKAFAKSRFGRLDIAVNAAGIANANPALEMETEQWQRVIDINLTGVWNSCKAEAELMQESGGGSIINIASMSGSIANHPQPQCGYNTSKAGVIMLTKSLAAEWAPRGVRVNAVAPTYIETEMNHYVYNDPELMRHWVGGTPQNRMGRPDEVASVILFLASDAASFINAIELFVDGGMAQI